MTDDDARSQRPDQGIADHLAAVEAGNWRKHRTAAALALLLVFLTAGLVGWGYYSQWRLGQVTLRSAGTVLSGEIIDARTDKVLAQVPVPTKTPISLPAGDYQLRLSARGFLDETRRIRIDRGVERSYDVQLGAGYLWPPIAGAGDYETANLDGSTDLFILTGSDVRRVDGGTGKDIWDTAPNRTQEYTVASAFALMKTPVDLNADGIRDVVVLVGLDRLEPSHKPIGGIRAYSGKDGQILWRGPPDVGTIVGQPVVADADGDGTSDLIASCAEISRLKPVAGARSVLAISGRTGEEIWRYRPKEPWFGLSKVPPRVDPEICRFAWHTGEQTYEILGPYAPAMCSRGDVEVVTVVAGTYLVQLDLKTGKPWREPHELGFWPLRPPRVADVDEDGLPEMVLVGRDPRSPYGQSETVRLMSLQTLSTLWEMPNEHGWYTWGCVTAWTHSRFAQALESSFDWPLLADLDGDGQPECILPKAVSPGAAKGVETLDGRSGRHRWHWKGIQRLQGVLLGPDLDGDRVREVFVVSESREGYAPGHGSTIAAISGKDGRTLNQAELPVNLCSSLGYGPGYFLVFYTLRIAEQQGKDGWPYLLISPVSPESTAYLASTQTGAVVQKWRGVSRVVQGEFNRDGISDYCVLKDGKLLVVPGKAEVLRRRLEGWQPAPVFNGDG